MESRSCTRYAGLKAGIRGVFVVKSWLMSLRVYRDGTEKRLRNSWWIGSSDGVFVAFGDCPLACPIRGLSSWTEYRYGPWPCALISTFV